MGLFFGKEKTSKDYLKEIANAQKAQVNAAKDVARAACEESNAQARIANAQARIANAQADEIKENTRRTAYEECQNKLQAFYDSFTFDSLVISDIEQKSMSIIEWLDTVDRKFKDKKSSFYVGDNQYEVDDDSRSKENALIKKLAFAVERLKALNVEESRLKYISDKLDFYENRRNQEAETKRKRRIKIIKITSIVSVIAVLIAYIVVTLPNAKINGDDCKAKVEKYISRGDLYNAYLILSAFEGGKALDDGFKESQELLFEECLKANNLELMIKVYRCEMWGRGDMEVKLRTHMIKLGMYDEVKSYYSDDYEKYTEECIKHMCENGEYDDARKFVKRQSVHSENAQTFIKKMNTIINSYL